MRKLFLIIVALLSCVCGKVLAYELTLESVTRLGLPLVIIETVKHEEPTSETVEHPEGCIGTSITNATKVPGKVIVITADGDTLFDSGDYVAKKSGMTIKHRGNTSTALFDKKAYKIKLQSKGDMLGRGNDYADKNWALLKNDYCNLNTLASLKVCELMGQEWVPAMRYVNVVFNGYYQGIYMLSETVERNTDCRVNIKKTGYIIESDPYYWNEDVSFDGVLDFGPYKFTFKYPDSDDVTDDQLAYIKDAVENMEISLRDGGYEKYIDISSFVDWVLTQDILGQADPGGSNRFLTKADNTSSSLFKMGTPWDFDCSFLGAVKGCFAYIHNDFYFRYLFANQDKTFAKTYVNRWKMVRDSVFDMMNDFLEAYRTSSEAEAVDKSWIADDGVWNMKWKRLANNGCTVDDQIDTLESWFALRKPLLDSLISQIDTMTTTGINEVSVRNNTIPDDLNTYNLMGQRVSPCSKGIVIRRGRKYLNRR